MNISKLLIKSFLLQSVFFSCFSQGYSQQVGNPELISVSLHVIAKGTTEYFKNRNPGYFVMATITNKQDTAIEFWIMNCSWPDVNWVTSNDSIYFGSHGCDNNFPVKIKLLPHKSINFYGVFSRLGNRPLCKKVKLGFTYFTSFKDIFDASATRSKLKKYKRYWSNEVQIEDNLFKYQMDL